MAKKTGKIENLIPFKAGEDERRNTAGRPEGSLSLKSIFDRLLSGKINASDLEGKAIKVTAKEAIALNMLATAIGEEDPNIMLKAAKDIFAHTDPITKEVALNGNLTVGGEIEHTPEQAAKVLAAIRGEI